jgi:hypothetical protein
MKPLWRPLHNDIHLVAQLLNQRGEGWDTNKVCQSFIHPDADEMFSIRVGKVHEDVIAWAYEKHGNYSIKSAYYMLSSLHSCNYVPSSSLEHRHPMWKHLWKMRILPKLRPFGGRF